MKNIKCVIIDGWNLFSYDGIPTDTEDKKTIAVKQLDERSVEIISDIKTMTFEIVINDETFARNTKRFSDCLRMADEYFRRVGEENK